MKEPLIQIAGVIDQAEADMLISEGIKYLGFPLRLPVNKEDLTEEYAAEIISRFEQDTHAVLITYQNKADDILEFCKNMNVNWIQLHADITIDELKIIKEKNHGLNIIKSLVVRSNNIDKLEKMVSELSPYVDYFITDTFDPITGASGATGKTHDWGVSKKLVKLSQKPVILAGGITSENVKEAILEVEPAGVDSHTGVEGPDGRKSNELIRKFIIETKKAFAIIKKRKGNDL